MLGKITMGKFGSILIKVIIIINNLGFCIAYFRIFGEVVQTIIQGWVSPESFWANNWHNFIYIIICSFIMFSFIFIKNLSALKKVAYMGVSVVLIFSLGLTLLFIHKGIHHYLDSNISWIFLKPNCSFSEAFHAIPSVFLAFLFQFNVFPIYLSLKEKNLETMMKATKIGVGYSLFIFLIVGIVGFLLYGLNMNDTLLNNFSDDMTKFRDISGFIKFLIIIISVSFVTTCLTSFPILYLSLRENFVNSLIFCMKNMNIKEKKDNNKNFISEKGLLIITVVLYILIIVMAIVLPKLKTIFSIVGATAGTFIAFILPNLFYIRICKISKKNYNLFLPMFFFGLGIFFLFISFIVSFI
jgi:amino acid permease